MSWTRVSRVEGSVRTRGKIDTEAKGKGKGKDKRILEKSEFMTIWSLLYIAIDRRSYLNVVYMEIVHGRLLLLYFLCRCHEVFGPDDLDG